jgi:hypothetical protein
MRIRRKVLVGAGSAVALVVSGVALAAAPWPGLARTVAAPNGEVSYKAVRAHGSTTVKAIRGGGVVASRKFAGLYGIPAVTANGAGGGLSPDGKTLVLVQPPNYQTLRTRSRFLLISTQRLRLVRTIVLNGEFGYDALAPDGRTLYLLQHTDRSNLVHYLVRAYDLQTSQLLQQPIVDKREPDENMSGYSVARATSANAAWVYTLYMRPNDRPFIHALDTVGRDAHCIDLPWQAGGDNVWNAKLELSADGSKLVVRAPGQAVATIDTKTFRVQ